jgi:hypothetical protein
MTNNYNEWFYIRQWHEVKYKKKQKEEKEKETNEQRKNDNKKNDKPITNK